VKLRIFYLAACQNRRLIGIFDTISVKNPLFQQPVRVTLINLWLISSSSTDLFPRRTVINMKNSMARVSVLTARIFAFSARGPDGASGSVPVVYVAGSYSKGRTYTPCFKRNAPKNFWGIYGNIFIKDYCKDKIFFPKFTVAGGVHAA
jgi:hypothetical protein